MGPVMGGYKGKINRAIPLSVPMSLCSLVFAHVLQMPSTHSLHVKFRVSFPTFWLTLTLGHGFSGVHNCGFQDILSLPL